MYYFSKLLYQQQHISVAILAQCTSSAPPSEGGASDAQHDCFDKLACSSQNIIRVTMEPVVSGSAM